MRKRGRVVKGLPPAPKRKVRTEGRGAAGTKRLVRLARIRDSPVDRLPPPRLLLQLSTQAHAAETSVAFGFSLKSSRHLLEAAKELGLQVVGVSFHVPASCEDPEEAYAHALSDARCVFDMGVSETLIHESLL